MVPGSERLLCRTCPELAGPVESMSGKAVILSLAALGEPKPIDSYRPVVVSQCFEKLTFNV